MDFIRKTRFGMVGITLNEDHAVLKSKDLPAEIIRGTFDDPDTVVKCTMPRSMRLMPTSMR